MTSAVAPQVKQLRISELVRPHDRQRQFLDAVKTHKYVLYGGAAGGGKSFILRWWLLIFLLKAWSVYKVKGVRVGLFCEDYPALRDRQASKIKHEFPPELGELKSSKEEGLVYLLRPELGGGFIALRNLDDASKYQSTEFAAIAVDELTKNGENVFEELRARLRWPGFPDGFVFPFAGATNPGGIGHAWVKRYWVDEDIPPHLPKEQFAFVKSKATDNPHNPKDYYANLLTLSERLRKIYAEGNWDEFAGQFFGEWRNELHVCEPIEIPKYWKRFRASDWGYSAAWCVLWFAVGDDGTVYVYRELYETQRDAVWMAQEVNRLSAGEQFEYSLLDPACWDASKGPSIAEQLARAGWACSEADNDRTSGWSQVRQYLAWRRDEQGNIVQPPKLKIFKTCTNLIRTLPALPFSKTRPEDVDTDAEDHAADTLRYGLMSRPPVTQMPIALMSQENREAALRLEHELRGDETTDRSWSVID